MKGEWDKTRLASEKLGGGNSAASGRCASEDLHSAESVRVQSRELCDSNGAASSGTQLKCLYANTRSKGNKQEELEMCAHLWCYDIIGITETWWDSSYDWSTEMGRYRLFRKDREVRQGGAVALYVKDQCMELRLGLDEEPTESLWVKIKGRAGTGDITVGVCYRPPD